MKAKEIKESLERYIASDICEKIEELRQLFSYLENSDITTIKNKS